MADDPPKPLAPMTRRKSMSGEPDKAVTFNNPGINNTIFTFTNYIKTSKYTVITFLPMNLLEQFRQVSNIFFLLNVIITLIPGVSPIVPATAALPLIFVLTVAAFKDGFEDFQRHVQDDKANSMPARVLRAGNPTIQVVRSQDVVVGDILVIENNQEVVADAIVVHSSLPEGLVYIDTAMLDGETNLKSRRVTRQMVRLEELHKPETLVAVQGRVVIQKPEPTLGSWRGVVEMNGENYPLSIEQYLYRGAVVRDTEFAYALVVYVGPLTKMFLNLKKRAPKSSILDRKLNKLIGAIFLVKELIGLCLCGGAIWFQDTSDNSKAWYLNGLGEYSGAGLYFWRYLTYFVLLSNFIPISLFVTLELCKAVQALLMMWDLNMYHVTPDGRVQHCKPKTSNLNEQLSVVKYIFSDKTGTLTKNQMQYIGGTTSMHVRIENIATLSVDADNSKYFTHLALCNTCLPKVLDTGVITYQSVSPDEVALCDAATSVGIVLRERSLNSLTLAILGHNVNFEILSVLEFTAERKMMSVVVREQGTSEILLFTKGADSSMKPNIVDWVDTIDSDLDHFALTGFRTLVLGMRVLPEDEYHDWAIAYDAAKCNMHDKEAAVHRACLQLEQRLNFAGVTAIEDELQEQVPETIRMMLNAKIVVWMLTGDKRETAVNVGVSCGLVRPQVDSIVHLRQDDVVDKLQLGITHVKNGRPVCAVLDGDAFREIEKYHKDLFMELGLKVRCSVCCRLSPGQKATIVRFFQQSGESTLAIGDGANDVPMIQESYVGIGIMGLEGAQAELTSDYAVPRFKHLQRLLFVHGRNCLQRNTSCVLYSLYKNAFLTTTQILYQFYSGFSGNPFYDSWLLAVFNMIFCSLPPLAMGMFEKDIPDEVALADPTLYTPLREGQFDDWKKVLGIFSEVLFDGFFVFFLCWGTLQNDDMHSLSGRTTGSTILNTMTMTAVIFVCYTRAVLMFRTWTVIPLFCAYYSYAAYFFVIFVYSTMEDMSGSSSFYQTGVELWTGVKTTLYILFFAFGWKLLYPFSLMAFLRNYYPEKSEGWLQKWVAQGKRL
eukprot:PhF_6_TR40821/c0_g1_i1/m.61764/K14802/DRS2, ATP8A; phospholipid-transporting ATPase